MSQERAKKVTTYSELVDSDAKKTLAYTLMVQELFTGDFVLSAKLHPEYKLDFSDQQQLIFAQQKPCEFEAGYLYHGRGDLSKILLDGFLPANSYLTRVPQTWALQPFVDMESGPAIFVIDALDFNRMQNQGKAELRLRTDPIGLGKYDSEPYPSFTERFSVNSILQIITNEDTYNNYNELVKKWQSQSPELTDQQREVAKVLKPFFDEGRIVSFGVDKKDKLEQLSKPERFLNLNKEIEAHMRLYGLIDHMPGFRIQTATSTGKKDKSPKPLTPREALVGLKDELNILLKGLKEQEQKALAAKIEKIKKERLEFWTNTGLVTGGTLALTGGGYYVVREVKRALALQEAEEEARTDRSKRG